MSKVDLNYSHRGVYTRSGKKILGPVEIRLSSPCLAVVSGSSGSGKSTLLRSIAGLVEAAEPRWDLCGRRYLQGELPKWRSRVSLLMQDAPVLDGSVEENLSFPFRLRYAGPRRFDLQEARRLLSEVRLEALDLDGPASKLSGGERHRLSLVRGLLWNPDVLLADEPLTGLEPELADHCFELLRLYVQREGKIVICVLHEHRFSEMADYRFRVEDGRLY
jgi:putative ABC transport system ATP-binding protein